MKRNSLPKWQYAKVDRLCRGTPPLVHYLREKFLSKYSSISVEFEKHSIDQESEGIKVSGPVSSHWDPSNQTYPLNVER